MDPAALREARDKARAVAGVVEGLAKSTGALRLELDAKAQHFRARHVLESIPMKPQMRELAAAIKALARTRGIASVRFDSGEQASRAKLPPFPAHYKGPGPYPFHDADLIGVLRFHLFIPPTDPHLMKGFVKSLQKSLPRMVRPVSVELKTNHAIFTGDAFTFLPQRAPVESLIPMSAESIYQEVGLDPGGGDCGVDATCTEIKREIVSLLAPLPALRPKAELALNLRGERDLWAAREAAFDRLREEIEKINYAGLLK